MLKFIKTQIRKFVDFVMSFFKKEEYKTEAKKEVKAEEAKAEETEKEEVEHEPRTALSLISDTFRKHLMENSKAMELNVDEFIAKNKLVGKAANPKNIMTKVKLAGLLFNYEVVRELSAMTEEKARKEGLTLESIAKTAEAMYKKSLNFKLKKFEKTMSSYRRKHSNEILNKVRKEVMGEYYVEVSYTR